MPVECSRVLRRNATNASTVQSTRRMTENVVGVCTAGLAVAYVVRESHRSDWPHKPVIALKPFAVNAHRCEATSLSECRVQTVLDRLDARRLPERALRSRSRRQKALHRQHKCTSRDASDKPQTHAPATRPRCDRTVRVAFALRPIRPGRSVLPIRFWWIGSSSWRLFMPMISSPATSLFRPGMSDNTGRRRTRDDGWSHRRERRKRRGGGLAEAQSRGEVGGAGGG